MASRTSSAAVGERWSWSSNGRSTGSNSWIEDKARNRSSAFLGLTSRTSSAAVGERCSWGCNGRSTSWIEDKVHNWIKIPGRASFSTNWIKDKAEDKAEIEDRIEDKAEDNAETEDKVEIENELVGQPARLAENGKWTELVGQPACLAENGKRPPSNASSSDSSEACEKKPRFEREEASLRVSKTEEVATMPLFAGPSYLAFPGPNPIELSHFRAQENRRIPGRIYY